MPDKFNSKEEHDSQESPAKQIIHALPVDPLPDLETEETDSDVLQSSQEVVEANSHTSKIGEVHQFHYVSEETIKAKQTDPVSRWIFNNPVRMITMSFLFLIVFGGILLTLPIASQEGVWTDFFSAIFTSTSAVCVTGLVLFDTATYWTVFGQVVIICLIQLGGIGLLTVVAAFYTLSKKKMNLRYVRAVQESTGSDDLSSLYRLVRFVLIFALGTEIIGGLLLSWRYSLIMPFDQALGRGLFQGVSAFCNAGFDLLGTWSGPYSSLMSVGSDPIILIVTALLLTFGGMGFIVWIDVYDYRKTGKLAFHSKIVIALTAGILLIGTISFAILEWNNLDAGAMGHLKSGEKVLAAFFQTATLRTAGFNSINQNTLSDASKLLSCLIMFAGASPISTGGGMKITTIAIIIATVRSNIKGQNITRLFKHKISKNMFTRAFVIVTLGALVWIASSFILTMTEASALHDSKFSTIDIVFETISALATVGVTSIQTENISLLGRIPILFAMYIGRVGPFAFALLLAFRNQRSDIEEMEVLPEGLTYIG